MMFMNCYRGKKVLVTGHTGFKGSWLCEWLLELGAEVAGFSVDVPTSPSHFEELNHSSRIKDFRGDIRDPQSFQQIINEFQPEILFHLAAQPIVSLSLQNPFETFEVNTMGSVRVLETLRNSKSLKAAVMITSDKAYENVEWDFGYREVDRLGGKDPYSASKACAEIAFSSYFRTFFGKEGMPLVVTARAGNVIGGGDWAVDRIVPDAIRAWSENKSVTIRNPNATRPWQHVLEPLSGYLWLGTQLLKGRKDLNGESFNFGPAAEVCQSVKDLLAELTKVWSAGSIEIEANALTGKEAGLLKLCCDKALRKLEWRAALDFEETAEMTAKWYNGFYTKQKRTLGMTQGDIKSYCELSLKKNLAWANN
jgi:CDP-glucose 4,6-dehydratase